MSFSRHHCNWMSQKDRMDGGLHKVTQHSAYILTTNLFLSSALTHDEQFFLIFISGRRNCFEMVILDQLRVNWKTYWDSSDDKNEAPLNARLSAELRLRLPAILCA